MKIRLFIVFLLIQSSVFAQDIHVLQRIDSLQSRGTEFYRRGLFPSQMTFMTRKLHQDNSIFLTAETIYTLKALRGHLGIKGKTIDDSIIARTKNLYAHYRNRNGGLTYNFFQTYPDVPYPGLPFWSKKKFSRIPDDLDCVSFIYMDEHTSNGLNATVKRLMELETRYPKKVKSTFRRYQNSKAYRSWFATRMKQDLDISVMSNVLLFVYTKGLPLDSTDYSTIALIKKMVNDNDIMKHGFIVSTYYQTSPIILYHLTRMIAVADNLLLNSLIPKIVADLKADLKVYHDPMDQIILLSSLYRLHHPEPFDFKYADISNSMNSFYWFYGNLLFNRNIIYKRIAGQGYRRLNFIKYKCNAFYWSLVLELQTLSDATIKPNGSFLQTIMYKKR